MKKGKVLICFSGSDGKFELTKRLAEVFRSRGISKGAELPLR